MGCCTEPSNGGPAVMSSRQSSCHWEGDLVSLLSSWLDFGLSRMNLFRRSVSELAWAAPYPSPVDKEMQAQNLIPTAKILAQEASIGTGPNGDSATHRSWRLRQCFENL